MQGLTGFRCRNIEQLVKAGQDVHTIDPEVCRQFAMRKYSRDAVADEYELYFKNILKKRDPYTYTYLPLCPLSKVDEIRSSSDYSSVTNAILAENESRYGFHLSGKSENVLYTEHYDWRIDAAKNKKRKLTAVMQLSDPSEYEGGELQIQNGDIHVMDKTKGGCVVFPSWMPHRVTPVTRGARQSLVIYLEGPPVV